MSFSDAIKWLMLTFAVLGGVDAAIGNKLGIGEGFKQGFMTMGALVLSMVGMNTVAPLISEHLSGVLSPVFSLVGPTRLCLPECCWPMIAAVMRWR